MISALSQALAGIDAHTRLAEAAASRVARDGAGGDLAGSLIDLQRAKRGIQANVASVRTADEIIGTLLDVLA